MIHIWNVVWFKHQWFQWGSEAFETSMQFCRGVGRGTECCGLSRGVGGGGGEGWGLEWGSGVRSRGLLTYPPTYSPLQWTFHPLQPAAPDCATTHIGAALLCCLLQMLLTALLLASCLAYSLLTTFVAGEQFRVCPLRCRFPSLLIASFSHKHWIFFCVFSSICMLEMVR